MADKQDKNKKDQERDKSLTLQFGTSSNSYDVPKNWVDADISAEKASARTSPGEKLYTWGVYKGINYWVNLISSLVIADYFIHGNGKAFLHKSAKFLGNGSKSGVRNATTGLEQLFLNSGGWLLCVPIKIMEDHKRPIVHWLNKNFYHIDQRAADGHEETPDEIYIEQELLPRGWLNMLARRTLGSGSTILFGMALDHGFPKKLDTPITMDGKSKNYIGGKDRFTNWVSRMANQALNSGYVPGGKAIAQKEWVQRYISMAALDVFNTKITSSVMEMTNGAKHVKAPKETGAPVPPAPSAPNPIPPNDQDTQNQKSFASQLGDKASPAHKKILEMPATTNAQDMVAASRRAANDNSLSNGA